MTEYIPSHSRRRRKALSALAIENIELRKRLSALVIALEHAHNQLKEVKQWEALVQREAYNLGSAVRIATSKIYPDGPMKALQLERGFAQADQKASGRASEYIADRRYSLIGADHD